MIILNNSGFLWEFSKFWTLECIFLTCSPSGRSVNNGARCWISLVVVVLVLWSNAPPPLCLCAGWPSLTSTRKHMCSPAWCCPLRFLLLSAPARTWTTAQPTPSTPRLPLSSSTRTPPPRLASWATATPPAPQPLLGLPPPPQPHLPYIPLSLLPLALVQRSCITPHSSTSSQTVCNEQVEEQRKGCRRRRWRWSGCKPLDRGY